MLPTNSRPEDIQEKNSPLLLLMDSLSLLRTVVIVEGKQAA
jgi:hypothetical protein